jgi:hypothetical protein
VAGRKAADDKDDNDLSLHCRRVRKVKLIGFLPTYLTSSLVFTLKATQTHSLRCVCVCVCVGDELIDRQFRGRGKG